MRHRNGLAIRISRIIARNDTQQDSSVFYRLYHRSRMIQRPCQRNHPPQAYASIRRLQTDDSAQGGWYSNGATGIGAHRAKSQCERHGDSRSPARTPGDPFRIPRIPRRSIVRIDRRYTESKLMKIGLSDHDRPRLAEFAHHRRIFLWHSLGKHLRTRRGQDAFGVVQILQRDRYTL